MLRLKQKEQHSCAVYMLLLYASANNICFIWKKEDSKEKKAPPKPRRLSAKLSASFFTPPSSDSFMSFTATANKPATDKLNG